MKEDIKSEACGTSTDHECRRIKQAWYDVVHGKMSVAEYDEQFLGITSFPIPSARIDPDKTVYDILMDVIRISKGESVE